MASLDLDDLPPRIAKLILELAEGDALLLVQQGAVMGRLIAQRSPPGAAEPESAAEPAPPEPQPMMMRAPVRPPAEAAEQPPEPPPPISSPAVEQKTREIFENFRAAIEDEF